MPLREDLRSVLVVGSGPIVIGQAAEFDYSGTQACHCAGWGCGWCWSTPTRPDHDRPRGGRRHLPGAAHPGPGGGRARGRAARRPAAHPRRPDRPQPGRGPARERHPGAARGRDRGHRRGRPPGRVRVEFTETCRAAGLDLPRGVEVGTVSEGLAAVSEPALPVVIRPSFTLGGWGGGIARTPPSWSGCSPRA